MEEVDAAYDLVARVFGPNYFEARDAKRLSLGEVEPLRRHRDVIIGRAGNSVVGVVRLISRRLRFGRDTFRVTGVTSVAVAPEWRGAGIGAGLMRVALDEGRRRGDDLSVLYARRAVDGWYPHFGYLGIGQHIEMRLLARADRVASGRAGAGIGCQSSFDDTALEAFASAYASTYRSVPGSFVRPRVFWQRLAARLRLRPSARLLRLTAGARRTVGYALVEDDRVWEIALPVEQVQRGVAAVAADLRERGHATPVFRLHPVHPVMTSLFTLNHTISVRRAWDGGHMATALTSQAARRLRAYGIGSDSASGCPGDFRLWPVWSPLDEF